MTQLRFNPNLLKVPLYIAGKSVEDVQAEYGVEDVLKLASNENPLGPSPLALEAARQQLPEAHRYPGVADRTLRRRLGALAHPGFDERHVITGNGATELIRMMSQAFLFDGGAMVTSAITFPMYHLGALMFGGQSVLIPPAAGLRFDLPAIAQALGPETRLVFLCTPNNPTGLTLSRAEIEDFMRHSPDENAVVVFDESYRDFVDVPDYLDPVTYVSQGRHVIILRSFSKSGGLANMRVGYAISTPEIVEYLHHAQTPFNTGAVALAAAYASLDDHDHLERSRCLIREEREFMYAALDALDVVYLRSQANFVLITDLPVEAKVINEHLLRRGIIIRPMGGWGLPHALRVTLGTRPQNERFIATFRAVLEECRAHL